MYYYSLLWKSLKILLWFSQGLILLLWEKFKLVLAWWIFTGKEGCLGVLNPHYEEKYAVSHFIKRLLRQPQHLLSLFPWNTSKLTIKWFSGFPLFWNYNLLHLSALFLLSLSVLLICLQVIRYLFQNLFPRERSYFHNLIYFSLNLFFEVKRETKSSLSSLHCTFDSEIYRFFNCWVTFDSRFSGHDNFLQNRQDWI